MDLWLAADPPFFGGPGQGTRQIIELFVAFGMAAGAGLQLLACTVTAMHFLIILGFMPVARDLPPG